MKRFLALNASAGSGKTYALALRYLALLFLESNPYDIVAVTFTNKAANEMRERVGEFLTNFDEKKADEISQIISKSKAEILASYEDVFKKYLSNRLNITTIDSFIQSVLRKFVYYTDLRSDFEIVEELDVFEDFVNSLEKSRFEDFVKLALKFDYSKSSLKDFLTLFYKKSKEIDSICLTPLKKPDESEAKSAFNRLKDYILNSPQASDAAKKAVKVDFYSIYKQTWFKKESLKDYNYFKKKELYQEWFEDVLRILKEFFKEYKLYEEYLVLKDVLLFYKEYESFRKEFIKKSNILSFEDVKLFAYELLGNIDNSFLYFRLDSQIDHILIDEFQDTSLVEWSVFEPIVDEMASGENRRSFFYVGDKKQAIYAFKGGMAELFDYVLNRYSMSVENLNTNYRSKAEIVKYVNDMYGLNQQSKKDGGYVEVFKSEDILEDLKKKILFLKDEGVDYKDIAILVHTNKEIEKVAAFLKEELNIKAKTSSSKEVIHHPYAYAIIELIKYLYNPDITLHLFNFEAVAKEYRDDIEINRPLMMVKEIASKYNLWDESVLELIEHSADYVDILDFVHNIDSFSKELENSDDGIEILTIHKSKGLAFKNVIVLDRLSKKRAFKDKIIFDYEGVRLKRLLLRNDREGLDSDYEAVLDKEFKKEQQEYKNLVYVALTRAEDSLIVIKQKELMFLKDIKVGLVTASSAPNKEPGEICKVEVKPLGEQVLEFDIEEEYQPNDYEAIYLGLAYHSSLEISSKWAKSRYAVYGIDFEKIKKDVKMVEDFLKRNFKGKFYKEIAFKKADRVGIIDLLIKDGDKSFIIDYKSVKPNDLSGYIKQVNFYKSFVKNSKGYLFFIDRFELKEV